MSSTDELLGGERPHPSFTAIRFEWKYACLFDQWNKVVEMDPNGKVVWSRHRSAGQSIDDACGGQRLPNGNTVITAYHAKKGIKSATPDKKIVWTLKVMPTTSAILTTNGKALVGAPLR